MSRHDPAESYRRDRVSPRVRFDEVEATVSHLFRRPHPALGGRTFGGALHAALSSRGLLDTGEVWELGGGAGFVAEAMVAEASKSPARPPLRYGFLELSRPLLKLQRTRVPFARAVAVHAERLPFKAASLRGHVLANEVIADLRVAAQGTDEHRELSQRYALPDAPLLNAGAIRLVEELARVLAPGASACLTEFGGDQTPSPVSLFGGLGVGEHVEHTIHFGHLEAVARAHGLATERVLLADLLGIDRKVRVASYLDVMRLRRFVPSLPVLAHPRAEVEARHPVLTRIFRFDFPEIGSRAFPDPQASAGFCQLFFALLLRR